MPVALVVSALIIAGALGDTRTGLWVVAAILGVMAWLIVALGVRRR